MRLHVPKLVITVGLPGSGKTTWARGEMLKHWGRVIPVSLDTYRAAKMSESQAVKQRDSWIRHHLRHRKTVIVADTNLNPNAQQHLRDIAREFNADFEIKDFTHITPQQAIERQKGRPRQVPEEAIWHMYHTYVKPHIKKE